MKTLSLLTLLFTILISARSFAQEGQINQEVEQGDASYPGGQAAMDQYINDNMQYPQESIDKNEEGVISVMLTVNADGSISNVFAGQNDFPLLAAEAVRLVKAMPNWVPAKMNGMAIKQQVYTPISFVLTRQ